MDVLVLFRGRDSEEEATRRERVVDSLDQKSGRPRQWTRIAQIERGIEDVTQLGVDLVGCVLHNLVGVDIIRQRDLSKQKVSLHTVRGHALPSYGLTAGSGRPEPQAKRAAGSQ